MRIRQASGVPVRENLGMSVSDIKRGLAALFPWVVVYSGAIPDSAIIDLVRTGQHLCLMIDFSKVPATSKMRRFVGSYKGGHAGWIDGAKRGQNGGWLVHWFDPFAPPGHTGRWLAWSNFRSCVYRHDGLVRHFYLKEGQAVSDFPIAPLVKQELDSLRFANEQLNHQLQLATEAAQRAGSDNATLRAALHEGGVEAQALADKLEAASV
jgi:hypothetical protein